MKAARQPGEGMIAQLAPRKARVFTWDGVGAATRREARPLLLFKSGSKVNDRFCRGGGFSELHPLLGLRLRVYKLAFPN